MSKQRISKHGYELMAESLIDRVWVFCADNNMSEPEKVKLLRALSRAAREYAIEKEASIRKATP